MLVGREIETRALHDALARLESGAGSQWLVRGEAGIGKSALLADLRDEGVRRGAAIADIVLIEGATVESLWPWIIVAQELVHALSPEQRSAAAKALGPAGVGALNTACG
ncbi:MAG: ATP-binding protein [Halomonas sp.]|uniref:ATP-binding protein n=1 Tax=Halomonas sp. TaxID=1486246 RepID=UPI002ACE9042|nr:ATP-binding protein [Halomonas sp.]MDZ7852653.1 ATP-binding protein [Halomonas sp.]